MRVWERLQLAFYSPFGTLLLLVFIAFIFLCLLYFFLLWRKKKSDHLAYLNSAYYEKAETILAKYRCKGRPLIDLFGRRSIVDYSLVCLIPPPDLVNAQILDRWNLFLHEESELVHPAFARQVYLENRSCMISLQSGLLSDQARHLPNFRHCFWDSTLSLSIREGALLELASALSLLHSLKTENGRPLYHGILLPSLLFLKEDREIVIADTGIAFAFGAQCVHERFKQLRGKDLPIERYRALELLEEEIMLSPEQKDLALLDQVGPCSDFYAFGALAVSVFTAKRFVSDSKIDWKVVPASWHLFLQRCLSLNPKERPKDFKELEWLLSVPEFALTHQKTLAKYSQEEKMMEWKELPQLMEQLKKEAQDLDKSFIRGKTALMQNNFSLAKKHFNDLIVKEPHNGYGYAYLAISYYEMGEHAQAQHYYEKAKSLDVKAAREYREYLTFRI